MGYSPKGHKESDTTEATRQQQQSQPGRLVKGRSNGNISLMAPLRRDAVSRGHRSRERAVQTLKLQSVPQTDQAGPALVICSDVPVLGMLVPQVPPCLAVRIPFKVLLKAQLLSRFAPTGPFNPATWDTIPSLSRCSFLFFVLFCFTASIIF